MIPEIGNLFLYLACAISGLIVFTPIIKPNLKLLRYLWLSNFIFLAGSLLCLIYSFIISDFSVLCVVNNSHILKPLIYRISAAWGNHEGSMLLWLSSIAFFSLLFAFFSKGNEQQIVSILAVQGLLVLLFLLYVISVSSPFIRIFPAPLNGLGLNPILQDVGLSLHPPILYLGYVGFSLAFSAAIAGLLTLQIDKNWARLIQPWVLMSWAFLSLGVTLGSWWAYRELGWGGYWFWDPVENSSLMPWLTATALLHSLAATSSTGKLTGWSLFLAIMTFSLSMIGTFLVRSGVITSVHSFASDPTRGIYILIIIGILTGMALLLFALRAAQIKRTENYYFLSRESFISINNILLTVAATVVVVGTIYPIILQVLTNRFISVGAPYYNKLIVPLALMSLVFSTLVLKLKWNTNQKIRALIRTILLIVLATIISRLIFIYNDQFLWLEFIGVTFSLWLILATLDFCRREKFSFSSSAISMIFAHIGFACICLGISTLSAFQDEVEKVMNVDDRLVIANKELLFKGVNYYEGPNYYSRVGTFEVNTHDGYIKYLYPEMRMFYVERQQTSEAAIYHNMSYDLYLTIGEVEGERIAVKAFYRPGISLLWFGGFLLFIGGLYGLLVKLYKQRQNR